MYSQVNFLSKEIVTVIIPKYTQVVQTFVTLFAFETSSGIPLCDSFCHVAMCMLALTLRPKLSAKRKCNNTLTRGKVCSESAYNFSNINKLRNHM